MGLHQCERCQMSIGFKGICWKCSSRMERESYESLTAEQWQGKLHNVIARIDEVNEWKEIYKDFYAMLAYTDLDLSAVATAALEQKIYYPGLLYRDATSEVQEELIRLLLQPDISSNEAGHLMLCLAAAEGERVAEVFAQLEREPLPWRNQLYVGPAIYAQQHGWGFNSKNERVQLHYEQCYALLPGEVREEVAEAGKLREEEYCSDCGCQLVDILRLDGRDARLSFLQVDGVLNIPVCPNCCTMNEKNVVQYDEVGNCTMIVDGSGEGNYVSAEDLQTMDQMILTLTKTSLPKYYACGGDEVITIGGQPDWIQDAQIDACPSCEEWMVFMAAVPWSAIYDSAEGTLYIEHCPDCRMISMHHQQT